jgi:hypothetical protein
MRRILSVISQHLQGAWHASEQYHGNPDAYLDLELAAAAGVFVRDVIAMAPGAEVLITTDSRTDLRVSARDRAGRAAAGGVPMHTALPLARGVLRRLARR